MKMSPRDAGCRCFAGEQNSAITLRDGEKYVEDLKIGDVVKVFKDDRTQFSPVWQFGHQDPNRKAYFIQIDGETKRVVLSFKHYIHIGGDENKIIMAKDVKVGDLIFICDEEGNIKSEKVKNIEIVEYQGIFAPFTEEGNIFVNGILCSCYSEVKPSIAHKFLAPFRAANKILASSVMKKVMKENKEGIPHVLDAAYTLFKPIVVKN